MVNQLYGIYEKKKNNNIQTKNKYKTKKQKQNQTRFLVIAKIFNNFHSTATKDAHA